MNLGNKIYLHWNIYSFENDYIELNDEKKLYNFHNYFHQNEFLKIDNKFFV